MTRAIADFGSFRDPSGRVFHVGDKIFRTVTRVAAEDFEFVRASGLIERLTGDGRLIGSQVVPPDALGEYADGATYVVEHTRLPFVSYPYEWSFAALRTAALHHLDIHLAALDVGVTLSDASAYNIQFQGARAVFIDLLSFRRYQNGEMWSGHRQFCEQFLNPLLLRAKPGIPHNAWYRGTQEGIGAADLRRLLPWHGKLSRNVLLHVVAQSAFQKSPIASGSKHILTTAKFPLASYRRMLSGLGDWIATLAPADQGKTTWQDYARSHSYGDDEVAAKKDFVARFFGATKPDMVWDLGCNIGDYATVALDSGATHVVGFDFDHGALELAFSRALAEDLNFLPLFNDGANPSPDQGWHQRERKGLASRADADAILALAWLHHIAIGRNIPIDDVIDWLMGLAPRGIIEFVPKQDPMVRELLALRDDIFSDYTEDYFFECVARRGRIVETKTVTRTGRKLVWYERA